jgi:site-specific DNA-cytosine methylase
VKSKKLRWQTDSRVDMTRRHFDLMLKYRPLVWAWESVPRAGGCHEFVKILEDQALAAGYSVTKIFLDAWDCGCPHRRRRFFMLCHRVTLKIEWPRIAHVTPREALKNVVEYKKSHTFFDDGAWVRPMRKQMLPLLPHAAPGESMRKLFDQLHPNPKRNALGRVIGRPIFCSRRCSLDIPCATIVNPCFIIHPTENRNLSLLESLALCGYPLWFRPIIPEGKSMMKAKIGSALQLLTRAVMPPVAEWLGSTVMKGILKGKRISHPSVRTLKFY